MPHKVNEIIEGRPIFFWMSLFHDCHEFFLTGAEYQKKDKKIAFIGDYRFIAWPDGKSLLEQDHRLVQIFNALKQAERSAYLSSL